MNFWEGNKIALKIAVHAGIRIISEKMYPRRLVMSFTECAFNYLQLFLLTQWVDLGCVGVYQKEV